MKAVILLGGQGTRLRPFTLRTPKPLLPLLNRPMIFFQLSQLKRVGVREVVLALGHGAAHFRRPLGDGRRWGMKFRYSIEKAPLGTGGALRLAARFVDGPAFVLNGDVLSDIDLPAMWRAHRARRAEATLALTPVEDPSAFGVAATARDGRVLRFVEKPAPGTEPSKNINAGVYLFEPSVFAAIPAGRPVSVERETFPCLLAEGRRVYAHFHRGSWADVGTLKTYHRAHADLLARYDAWDRLFRLGGRRAGPARLMPGAKVHRTARLSGRLLIGPGARVEEGAVLSGFVCLGPAAVVGPGSRVRDAVVHAGARLGEGCRVEGALVGEKARIDPFAVAGPVVGPGERWTLQSRPPAEPWSVPPDTRTSVLENDPQNG